MGRGARARERQKAVAAKLPPTLSVPVPVVETVEPDFPEALIRDRRREALVEEIRRTYE